MSLCADDVFLDAIAHQARVVYATQQLHVYRNTLQRWQMHTGGELGADDGGRVQHELAYYTQQVERWQSYSQTLGEWPNALGQPAR